MSQGKALVRDRVRLISANLRNGRADAKAFASLVAALEPDVVAVQEMTPAQAAALARVMPFGRLQPASNYTGMGIALRGAGTVRRLPLPGRDGYVAELPSGDVSDGGDPLEIINVHITAPHVLPVWRTVRHRRGQLRGLERYLDTVPRRRRVVVGDLNATPLWPVYRRLVARFTDAAVEAARRNGIRPRETWGPWSGAPRLFRIDHVLVSGLAAHDVRVMPLRGSDHSALVVDLSPETVSPRSG